MNEKDLLKMKEDIEQTKSKVSELTGKEKHLLQELKDKWQCLSVEDAEKALKKLNQEIKSLDLKIGEGIKKIESQYNT